MSYEIKLPLFEGPFDLLLFFIERDELDIYDIPIATITNDFLHYLHQLESMNMEIASEFILVAATLMRIKAKMLLPRPVLDDEGNEIDPREELVKHLLEYKKYKALLEDLSIMENDRSLLEKRGNIIKELKSLSQTDDIEWELQNVDLYKLLKVFQKVMDRYKEVMNKPHHKVIQWPYTIESQKKYLLDKLKIESRVSFTQVIDDNPTKMAVIFNFLSILELLQLKIINLHIGIGFNNFWIESFETIQAN